MNVGFYKIEYAFKYLYYYVYCADIECVQR